MNGQNYPTVPKNVFRLIYSNNSYHESWNSGIQSFDLKNIGKMYFNDDNEGEFISHSSPSDLYNLGGNPLVNVFENDNTTENDSAQTIESWMAWFNNKKGTNLPLFEAGYLDTSNPISVGGTFKQSVKRRKASESYKIEYGLSNSITLFADFSIVSNLTIEQSIFEYQANPISGVGDLINYLKSAKLELENFKNSDTYFYMDPSLQDTIDLVYNLIYREDSPYSVSWVFDIGEDPLNTGLIGDRFIPHDNNGKNEIGKDTVRLSDFVDYYYPSKKQSSGLDDTRIGIKMLLKGSPAWSRLDSKSALYGILQLLVPSGYTIRSFKTNNQRQKQFSTENIGIGVKRYSIGLFGDYFFMDKRNLRIFGKGLYSASTPENLYTPAYFLAANHTNPDSNIVLIGETYKYIEGSRFLNEFGFGFDPKPNRFRIEFSIKNIKKQRDKFISNDVDWDKWMASHSGFDTAFKKRDMRLEAWLLNNYSQNRIGPVPFECFLGLRTNLSSSNTFFGSSIYFGLVINLQGW